MMGGECVNTPEGMDRPACWYWHTEPSPVVGAELRRWMHWIKNRGWEKQNTPYWPLDDGIEVRPVPHYEPRDVWIRTNIFHCGQTKMNDVTEYTPPPAPAQSFGDALMEAMTRISRPTNCRWCSQRGARPWSCRREGPVAARFHFFG
jgi:hypothetical protein